MTTRGYGLYDKQGKPEGINAAPQKQVPHPYQQFYLRKIVRQIELFSPFIELPIYELVESYELFQVIIDYGALCFEHCKNNLLQTGSFVINFTHYWLYKKNIGLS